MTRCNRCFWKTFSTCPAPQTLRVVVQGEALPLEVYPQSPFEGAHEATEHGREYQVMVEGQVMTGFPHIPFQTVPVNAEPGRNPLSQILPTAVTKTQRTHNAKYQRW